VAELKDILNSGDINTMVVADNIIYEKADYTDAEDMFFRMGPGGKAYLHKVPDQDVHMDSDYKQDVIPPEAWTEYFSITTNHELTSDNGTFVFTGDFFVIDNKERDLWLRALVNGTVIGSEEKVTLWKDNGTDHQQVTISRGIVNTIPSGAVVTFELWGESDGIKMNGAYQTARFRLTAAQSAPVNLNIEQISAFNWNELPALDPGVSGELYSNNGVLTISQG